MVWLCEYQNPHRLMIPLLIHFPAYSSVKPNGQSTSLNLTISTPADWGPNQTPSHDAGMSTVNTARMLPHLTSNLCSLRSNLNHHHSALKQQMPPNPPCSQRPPCYSRRDHRTNPRRHTGNFNMGMQPTGRGLGITRQHTPFLGTNLHPR